MPDKPLTLMLVAGEPSGDLLGAELMAALKDLTHGEVKIVGVGGEAMAREGLETLFDLSATAIMGLQEVVPKIPEVLRRIRRAAEFAAATKPDAVVLIDSPDFTHRVAKRIRKIAPGIPTINYVAPQVWATRPGRAGKMAGYFNLVLALLPFEPPFFAGYGLKAVFVGHPALARGKKMVGGADFRARHAIPADAPLLAVLPGSRAMEVRHLLPVFTDTMAILKDKVPGLHAAIPAVPHVAERIRQGAEHWPVPLTIVSGEDEKFALFDAADVALAASGTVTTELALSRTPMIVTYKVGALTAWIYRKLIGVKVRYYTLMNLILDRLAVPELMQEDCRPETVAAAVAKLLTDPAAAARQVADQNEALRLMGEGADQPSRRAARAILEFLGRQ
ncbi:lipid-A-disaccharide synthase [Rhizomicrobium electricum]|uniref:Lipid-A-disaccharide synthase n=1 Tax=Rhizomicrobium electricum TaxID=480070 RepID=A0ABP3PV56_9PROT|nr:lipid-A-disaccharide synthase [Rhizomicrobium electricum]NIJ48941.1 lipid-A-disaccharide synthase [Rhizomicrobium electricum]